MSWDNKIIWSEGMFLRTQHFQQQDRYVERLVRNRTAHLRRGRIGILVGVELDEPLARARLLPRLIGRHLFYSFAKHAAHDIRRKVRAIGATVRSIISCEAIF